MSLRDTLANRPPRRATVALSKPHRSADVERLREQRNIVGLLEATGNPEAVKAREALGTLEESLNGAVTTLAFRSIGAAAFEAMVSAHTDPRTGDVDRQSMRPHLFAACAEDEELQDHAWWASTLQAGKLTAGDVETLWVACWGINATQGDITVPLGD